MGRRAADSRPLILLGILILLWAKPSLGVPDNTLSITPSATAGTTITAADENDRNNDITSSYNNHSHLDISSMSSVNTFSIGDGAAGTKSYVVNDEQTSSPGIRYTNSRGWWEISTDGSTFDAVGLSSGVVIIGENDFRIGDNLGINHKRLIANENTTDGALRWNVTANQWEVGNDGATFVAIQNVSGAIIVSGVNEIQVGDGTATAPKYIYANTTSSVQDPSLRYQPATSQWQFSNNGTTWSAMGADTGDPVDAWVKFDGSGTVTIFDSLNCSSVTDVAAGTFQPNWSVTLSNADWCAIATAGGPGRNAATIIQATMTTTSVQVFVYNDAGGTVDPDECYVAAIGDGP